MDSNDDDEELAALRAQRAERMGGSAGLAELRAQQRRASAAAVASSQYYVNSDGKPASGEAELQGEESETEEDQPAVEGFVEDVELMHEELRSQLPMSFGAQEVKVTKPEVIHDKFKRDASSTNPSVGPPKPPGFGPPRPPGSEGSFGPPRPESVGSTRPAGQKGAWREVGADEGNEESNDRVGQEQGSEKDSEIQVGPPMPSDIEENKEEAIAGPPRPTHGKEVGGDNDDDDDDEDMDYRMVAAGREEEDAEIDPWLLPITHEVSLSGHTRAVTALDVEHSGSRVVTGGLDYMIRIYDFNGMKSDMKPFRELEAQEGHPVHAVSWSPTGDAFIVITGSSKAKVYDRDGHTLGEFIRGDMYIRDMKNTKGHVSGLCGGQWHPTDRFTAMTCSEDGTVRIWDTHNIMQKTVIKPNLAKPVRTSVTACRYSNDGKLIAAGLSDGSIQMWGVSGKFGTSAAVGQILPPAPQMVEKQGWSYVSRPNQIARAAHAANEEITGLTFSKDGVTLLSRGMDATLKIWDVRKFTKPVRVIGDLPCAYSNTMCIFSPDEQLVLTGVTTGNPQDETGALAIFNRSNGELVRKLGMPGSVTALAWHSRLNQILVGAGNRKGGFTRLLYDPSFSERGALLAAARVPRRANPFDYQPPLLVREWDPNKKRRRDQAAQLDKSDPKARRPDPGMLAGVGRDAGKAKLGTCSKTLLTQHILKTKGKLNSVDETEDPRQALLKHADKKDEFSLFTKAYAQTQPKPIFAEEEKDEEEDE